jgi:predicted RNA-binding protein with PIN domain
VSDALLRRALTAAVEVARAGAMGDPAVPAPTGLQPFLRFARLPPAALAAARRVLDTDAGFRARVAERTDEDVVGREGWLFLTRPPGWEAELDAVSRERAETEAAIDDQRAEQDVRRKVSRLEASVARLEAELAGMTRELEIARSALAEAQRAGRDAMARAQELEARLSSVRGERDRHRDDAQSAAKEVARLKGTLAAQHQGATVDIEAVTRAVVDATAAAGRLQGALHAASVALQPSEDDATTDEHAPPATPPIPVSPPPQSSRAGAARRQPARLPPGVLDDSDEAAAALVRMNGMVLLVDGYNVAMLGWPSRPIAEQRDRVVDALARLVARTGADVEVVFDGTDEPPAAASARRGVRVSFSPPDVEADDVLIDRAAEVPAHRPVTVASNDRRVQEGARAAGANVISSAQLLAVLRH